MKFNKTRKGQIWISAVIYILIISSSLLVVLKFGVPIIQEMKDRSTFEKTKNVMMELDQEISEVSTEGEGSQRVVTLNIPDGQLLIEEGQVIWEFETDSKILDERSSQNIGNLKIVSNANVKTMEYSNYYLLSTVVDYDSNNNPILFEAKIKKFGEESNWVAINASELIQNLTFNGIDSNGSFNLFLADNPNTAVGNGYTKLLPNANNTNLGNAKIIAHINSSTTPNFEYDLEITLNSYSDYLAIEATNIQIN